MLWSCKTPYFEGKEICFIADVIFSTYRIIN